MSTRCGAKVVVAAFSCMTLNCYLWLLEIVARADWDILRAAIITFSCLLRPHLALHGTAADNLETQVMALRLCNINLINNNLKRKRQNLNNWVMIRTHKSTKVRLRATILAFSTYI